MSASHSAKHREMKVLVSAYLCAPNVGSEEEVAMQIIVAAASQHRVWVLAHRDSASDVRDELERLGLADRVTVESLLVDPPTPGARDRSLPVRHWAYDAWQKAAQAKVIEMDRRHDFDVVHHATIASYWTRSCLAVLDKPFVLGPVGGGVTCPPQLLPALGLRGAVGYGLRTLTRQSFALRPSVRRVWRRATVILTQNRETAGRIPMGCNVQVYGNAVAGSVLLAADETARSQDLIFAGRLLPWKACNVAVRALAMVAHPGARLVIYGDGPEKPRIQALVEELGLGDRVVFPGRVARAELHRHMSTAGALVHPAVHEEGGLVMTEAMALGTPVVALNRGGVVFSASQVPGAIVDLVDPGTLAQTAHRLAVAIDRQLADPAPILRTPALLEKGFSDVILETYDKAVALFQRPVSATDTGSDTETVSDSEATSPSVDSSPESSVA